MQEMDFHREYSLCIDVCLCACDREKERCIKSHLTFLFIHPAIRPQSKETEKAQVQN